MSEADSKAIQKGTQNNLNFSFDIIRAFNGASDMPNYDSLINELNILLTRYYNYHQYTQNT